MPTTLQMFDQILTTVAEQPSAAPRRQRLRPGAAARAAALVAALLLAGPEAAGAVDSAAPPVTISFAEGSPEIPDSAKPLLDEMAGRLAADQAMRVQLLAYARDKPDDASQARRLSLSRALAVRAYLIARGLAGTRMDVRALGGAAPGAPADRVDIVPHP